jgi:hypothetical protein
MATVETGIYNALLQRPKSVAEYDNEATQMHQNRLTMQMQQSQMAEHQRGIQQENALANAYRNSVGADGTVDRNKLYSTSAQMGLGAKLPAMQKAYADQDKLIAETEDKKASTKKTNREDAEHQFEIAGQMAGAWSTDPGVTKQKIIAGLNAAMRTNVINDAVAQAKINELSSVGDDVGSLNAWSRQTLMQVMKAKDQFAMTDPDANAKLQAKTSIDNNNADNATSRANNAATVGASYANAAATRSIASATRDAASIRRDQETEMKLGDDYRTQSKGFKEVGEAYRTINATLDQATKSPAATLAAATKFMKLLDPGSVVRESELGMALAASGVFDRATNYFNVLQSGRVLTPNQVKDFKNITAQIHGAAQEGQRAVDASYKRQAEQYKLRPEMIIQDFGQNAAKGRAIPAPQNQKGWKLHTDAGGNKAYVSPDGKQFEEVK